MLLHTARRNIPLLHFLNLVKIAAFLTWLKLPVNMECVFLHTYRTEDRRDGYKHYVSLLRHVKMKPSLTQVSPESVRFISLCEVKIPLGLYLCYCYYYYYYYYYYIK